MSPSPTDAACFDVRSPGAVQLRWTETGPHRPPPPPPAGGAGGPPVNIPAHSGTQDRPAYVCGAPAVYVAHGGIRDAGVRRWWRTISHPTPQIWSDD